MVNIWFRTCAAQFGTFKHGMAVSEGNYRFLQPFNMFLLIFFGCKETGTYKKGKISKLTNKVEYFLTLYK